MVGHIFSFVFGLVVGSFLNVVIYRVPAGLSIVSPPSRCPKCETPIRWYWNIPVLSWLALRGRCAKCANPISPRYPMVELLTGLLALAVSLRYGVNLWGLYQFAFVAALVAITFIDLDHYIIPDSISLPGIAVGLVARLGFDLHDLPSELSVETLQSWFLASEFLWALVAVLAGGGSLWLIATIHEKVTGVEGLGGGDVKLLGMIGAFTSPLGVLQTILVGSLSGSVIGVLYLAISGQGSRTRIPFGPFLAFGALTVVLFPGAFAALLGI